MRALWEEADRHLRVEHVSFEGIDAVSAAGAEADPGDRGRIQAAAHRRAVRIGDGLVRLRARPRHHG